MVNQDIENHIQNNILPLYSGFDKGHGLDHVRKVIENSICIAKAYDVDMRKVYVIAAYHDVGLWQGRENHEKTSAAFLFADLTLMQWFTDAERKMMAEAVEDHRASNGYEPRSIYGKIISEADRDIDYETILTRTIQYGLQKNPDADIGQHFNRTYEHLTEKYGEGGYLTLWLDTELNRCKLKELRRMIASRETLRPDFDRIFAKCLEEA